MKRVLKFILGIILVTALTIGLYASYVFVSFNRIEDKTQLQISQFSKEEHIKTKTNYRVVSYNVGFGAYSNDYSFFMDGGKYSRALSKEAVYENINGSIKRVQKLDPTFTLFQEVDIDGTRSYHVNQQTLIEKAFGGYSTVFSMNYNSPYLLYPLQSPHGKNKAGLLTVSKVQIHSAIRRSLPIEQGLTKLIDLDRCYSVQRIKVVGDKELVLYNIHLSAYTTDPQIANNQLKMLFEDMEKEAKKGNYCIAGGDFNKDLLGDSLSIFKQGKASDAQWAKPINNKLIPDSLKLVAPYDKNNPVPSCRNADQPYNKNCFVLTVDGFVVSNNVKVKEAFVDDAQFRYSDHNPVVLDFSLE